MRTIMVTGSSGTVGTALSQRLLKENYNLIPLDIKRSIWDKKIDRKTAIVDLRKPIAKNKFRNKPDTIVHLAANARVHDLVVDPQKALDNYLMVHNMLEYARANEIKRIIFASSREVYGESGAQEKRKESSTHVSKIQSPYTASKYSAESLLHAYYHCYDIKPIIVRLSNVYGRYDISERLLPLFIYYARRNRTISIFGIEKKLDFTYIDDAVDGLTRAVKKFDKVAPNTFNMSLGRGTRIIDAAKVIIKELESESQLNIIGKRTGEISTYVGDISKAKKLLGYNPKIGIQDGIKRNIEWYLEIMKERKYYMTQRRDLMKRGWA